MAPEPATTALTMATFSHGTPGSRSPTPPVQACTNTPPVPPMAHGPPQRRFIRLLTRVPTSAVGSNCSRHKQNRLGGVLHVIGPEPGSKVTLPVGYELTSTSHQGL